MLILIVLICILIWYGFKRYKRSRDADGLLEAEEMSLKKEIREIVLKYKYFILIGSTIVVIGSIAWMYYIFYIPYKRHHVERLSEKTTWQFGTQLVWISYFADSVQHSKKLSNSAKCGQFSKQQCLHNMEVLKHYTSRNESIRIFQQYSDKRSEGQRKMYDNKPSIPVVVLQSSERDFKYVQRFVQESEKKFLTEFPDYQILIYDMGMTFQQKYMLLNCSQCEVVEDFQRNLTTYSFTPVLIYMSLQRFNSVIWVNAATIHLDSLSYYLHNESHFPGFQVNRAMTSTGQDIFHFEDTLKSSRHFSRDNEGAALDSLLFIQDCQWDMTLSQVNLIYANTSPFTMQNIILPWTLCAIKDECPLKELCKPGTQSELPASCLHSTYGLDFILDSLFGSASSLFYS